MSVLPVMRSSANLRHSVPAKLARTGFIALCAAICIPGFLVAFPQRALPSSISSGLFAVGLVLMAASVLTSITERVDRAKQPWVPVAVLAISATIPYFSPSVDFPGANGNWVLTHLALIAILLCTQYLSYSFIALVLRACMVASLLTLLGGVGALSADERSLFLFDGRLRGVFGHANMTGLVAVAAFLLALGSSRWKKTDLALSVAVIAAATSLTSLIAAAIGITALLIRERAVQRLVWAVGLTSLFVPAWVASTMGAKLDPSLFTGRSAAWQWAVGLDVPPWTGLGTGLFEALGSGKLVPWFHAHNQIIMDYLSGGWPLVCTTTLLLASVGRWAVVAGDRRQLAMWCVLVLQCATEVPLVLNYPSGSMLSTAIILLLIIRASNEESPGQGATTLSKASSFPAQGLKFRGVSSNV